MADSNSKIPQPTHGGLYELVDGQLRVIEGGPPALQFTPAPSPSPAPSPRPTAAPAPLMNTETSGEGA
jgi:hypothetical protein